MLNTNRFKRFLTIFISCLNLFVLNAWAMDEDATFRENIVGKAQHAIEKRMIEAKNGVFILFTPSMGTPLMISEKGDIPQGLIPAHRMKSYETTVKPRVKTTHQMPQNNIRCVLIRYQASRSQAEDPTKKVDDTYYKQFLAQYPNLMTDKIISQDLYDEYVSQGIPAAFYYFIENGKPHFVAIFGKQIHEKTGNTLSDPGVYWEREHDRVMVNSMLNRLGMPPVETIIKKSN